MASTEFQLSTYMRARLETWEDGVNNANNTSVVHARIKVWRTNSWSGQTYSSSVRKVISIDGTTVYDQTAAISHYSSYGEMTVAEASKTVTHNSDGSKSVGVSCSLTDNVSSWYNGSGSLTMGLTTIPRQANLNSAENFNDTGNPKITYTNSAGNSVSSLQAGIYGTNGTTQFAGYRDVSKTGSSYTFNLTDAEREALLKAATGNTMTVRFYLKTVIGSNTYRTTLDRTFTVVDANPVFSDFEYADTNSDTVAITGDDQYLIQGVSNLVATISAENAATAQKYATMQSYSTTINGQTTSADYSEDTVEIDLGTIDASADSILSVAALDSRGNRTTVNKTIKVIPYSAPAVIARGTRLNDFEAETTIHIEGSVSLIQVDDVTKNTVNSASGVKYHYREQGSSSWGNWTNVASSMGSNGVIGTTDFVLSLDNSKAYEFEASITDKLNTTVVSFTVGVGIPIFRIGTDGYCYNNEQPLMPSHVGQVIMSTTLDTADKVKAIYGGTWVAWGQGKVPVGVDTSDSDFNEPNKTGGAKTVTLDVTQIPWHAHGLKNVIFNSGSSQYSRFNVGSGGAVVAIADSTVETEYEGGGEGHPNLQPYITVYFWLRTV